MNDVQCLNDFDQTSDFEQQDCGDINQQIGLDYHSFDPDIDDLWEK